MSTSEFDKYKVDHLFLLIGENPLPNYVAAKTLLAEDGKPYLVFTEHTQNPAKRLKEALGLSDNEMIPLDNNESNAYEIKKRIQAKIKEIQDNADNAGNKSCGLNYTGGTKAMAVHAYQALLHPHAENPEIKLNPLPIFSYLDSQRLRMLIDNQTNPIPLEIPKEQLELSLLTLFNLHGFSLSKDIKTEVSLPNLVEAIFKYNSEWREWCRKVLYPETKEKIEIAQRKNKNNEIEKIIILGNWEKHQNLRKVSLLITSLPKAIVDELSNNNMLEDGKLSIQQIESAKVLPESKKKEKIPVNICKWLEGVWLEDYVLQQLRNIQKDCAIDEIGMSFNFPEKSNTAKFEFDVAFLRGYQLFALSCTTHAQPNLCKLKLFEAYRRARQIGGDEARVALVCCVEKAKEIMDDFLAQVNDPKVNVFGLAQLVELSKNLTTWIREVDA